MIVMTGADIVGCVVIADAVFVKLAISNNTGMPTGTSVVSSTKLAVVNVDKESC